MNYMQRQNLEQRLEWERRYRYRFRYVDLRGDLTGPLMDQDFANKRRLARAMLADIKAKVIRFPRWAANISFLRKQAN